MSETLQNAKASLSRIQDFDTQQLPRREELGNKFAFNEAVEPSNRLIGIFKKLPTDSLSEFTDKHLTTIQRQADQAYNLFDQILKFDETQPDSTTKREQIISNIENQYPSIFDALFPLISYSVARTVDFNHLEEQGRAALQAVEDRTADAVAQLDKAKNDASEALGEIRKAAAEQGVSQTAIYFKSEADREEENAESWKFKSYWWATGLAIYGVISLFLHKISIFKPESNYETFLLSVSKLIIFAVISYMLILSSRNFLSHKHNALVNRHRQNALQTFQTLVKAGSTGQTQDIILNHASSCIFAPQDTGFTKNSATNNPSSISAIELALRSTPKTDASA